jgi:hypothetical protein
MFTFKLPVSPVVPIADGPFCYWPPTEAEYCAGMEAARTTL